jgi:acyl-CoA thioesterase
MTDVSKSTRAAAAMFEADAASNLLGIEITRIASGSADGLMRITNAMLNGHGTCHGGYVFLFADTVFSCACNSQGLITVAAKADIVFVTPVREGDLLTAHAEQRLSFGRHGIYDVTVTREDATVVAEFRGHSSASRTPLPG